LCEPLDQLGRPFSATSRQPSSIVGACLRPGISTISEQITVSSEMQIEFDRGSGFRAALAFYSKALYSG